jgi:hypothetical protein
LIREQSEHSKNVKLINLSISSLAVFVTDEKINSLLWKFYQQTPLSSFECPQIVLAVCQHFFNINAYFFTAVSKTKKSDSRRDSELDKDNFPGKFFSKYFNV